MRRLSHFAFCILQFALCIASTASPASASPPDSLFSSLSTAISSLPVSSQIDSLRRFERRHRDFAPVCDRIARLYMSLKDPGDRQRATYWVRRAIRLDPDNPTYQAKGQYQDACDHYSRALAAMPADERAVLESIALISGRDADTTGDSSAVDVPAAQDSPRVDREAFWRRQDPLLLTDFNERRMAHYGRVFYAALRFEDPLNGRRGWETDMGKAFIKFGPPLHKAFGGIPYSRGTAENADELWAQTDLYFVPTHRPRNPLDVWRYESFILKFRGGTNPNHWVFDWVGDEARWGSIRRKMPPSGQIFEERPPRYVDPYRNLKHSVPHQVVAFKDGGKIRVEVSYALPRSILAAGDSSGAYGLYDGLFLYDEAWHEVVANRRQLDLGNVPPGIHALTVTVTDRISGQTTQRSALLRVVD